MIDQFSLKSPCKDCPFRTDVKPFLRKARVREITNGMFFENSDFYCHKTVEHDDEGEHINRENAIYCAGALIMMERKNNVTQLIRIAERLGLYDRTALNMDAPVYASANAMEEAQER